ncbi:MAG: DNA polymerase III subunit alpha [Saccharofermentans sp.]|nr:DNA polymerase III subunit alpha [Saccharofermentans sp.]
MSGFCHLHLHTEYSLLDGAIKIKELAGRLKDMGITSCAITDHGVMYGAVSFYREMKANGIHPIIGCEVYVAPGSRFDKTVTPGKEDKYYNHLVLLAKNNQGLTNLNRLVSAGFTEGFYRRPRIDEELLEKWHDGLICLSACVAGKVPSLILSGDMEKAAQTAAWYDSLFGRGNYYLEIQANTTPEQAKVNAALVKLSNETGIPLVATNDCHYLMKDDYEAQDVLLCISTAARIDDENRMRMSCNEFYVKSETEMRRFFPELSDAIDNTGKIADMCNAEYDFDTIHLPVYEIPEGYNSHEEYLADLTYKGLEKRFEVTPPTGSVDDYMKRAEYELGVINSMGYTDYYLIVWDFINYAKTHDVAVGPGRGSGAGSLVAYAVGITDIDPIRYGLVFERFLNSERVSMPDFDVDFNDERRQVAIDYVTAKYGKSRVAHVITFGTLAARQAVKDVARVLNMPIAQSNKLTKMIPFSVGMNLKQALEISTEFKEAYNTDPEARKVIDMAMRVEGLPRNAGTHAAGIIISGKDITDIAPLALNDDTVAVQFAKVDVESIGLLKFDFLGLRTLTVLQDVKELVKQNYGIDVELDRIPLDDPEVFKMIGRGETIGVFQLESRGMTSFMKQLEPGSLEDIIAGISLYRPGPMDQIPKYVDCKKNPSHITYDHPLLEPILNVTYGCAIYQEQVMQIVRDLAGFSMGQSDNIRRAMSKKKKSMIENYRNLFMYGGTDEKGRQIDGCIKRGVPEKVAAKIFDDVAGFAGYAFNKSHAACYAVVGYWTAYFKYHYPTEFMAATLNSFRGDLGKASYYISCCASMGIEVLPPDINKSRERFTTEGERRIRIGLSVIKNVGEGAVLDILRDREKKGDYKSFEDFVTRAAKIGVKKPVAEALILASCMDSFGLTRAQMTACIQTELEKLAHEESSNIEGQLSLFDLGDPVSSGPSIYIPDIPEYSDAQKLGYEKEMVGIYLSGNPLASYAKLIAELATFDMSEASDILQMSGSDALDDNRQVAMCGMVTDKRTGYTKKKTMMSTISCEDLSGSFEVLLFGKNFDIFNRMVEKNKPYLFVGRRQMREGGELSMFADCCFELSDDPALVSRIKNDRSYMTALRERAGASATITSSVPSPQNKKAEVHEVTPATDQPALQKQQECQEHVLRIRYNGKPNTKGFNRLLNFLAYFHGNMTVEILFESDKSITRLDDICRIEANEIVLRKLAELVGEDNIEML